MSSVNNTNWDMRLEGVDNFRDFGNLRTSSGGHMRSGKLFRSGDHSKATVADLQKLAQLDICTIIDLRRPIERHHAPSRRWPTFQGECVTCDIADNRQEWTVSLKSLPHVDAEWFRQDSLEFYRSAAFTERHRYLFAEYFRACAAAKGAMVVHCAAGKDRTGMICALTHLLLGVHHDDLMEEFLRTNDPVRIERGIPRLREWLRSMTGKSVNDAALEAALRVEPQYLDAFLASVREKHGTAQRYCEEYLSLSPSLISTIHHQLVERGADETKSA